jgi:hypothetical protein
MDIDLWWGIGVKRHGEMGEWGLTCQDFRKKTSKKVLFALDLRIGCCCFCSLAVDFFLQGYIKLYHKNKILILTLENLLSGHFTNQPSNQLVLSSFTWAHLTQHSANLHSSII